MGTLHGLRRQAGLALLAACTSGVPSMPPSDTTGGSTPSPHDTTPAPGPLPAQAATLTGAGDIGRCGGHADGTAALLDAVPGAIFTAGDNAYPDGTAAELRQCYDPTWGRHRARTHPSPGNHDYMTPGAADYFAYFGSAAGEPGKGYYGYEVGGWHVVALNSEIPAGAGSPQEQWLRQDLAAHPTRCTLAYWHRPRFSSGSVHGSDSRTQALWDVLEAAGAEIVVTGHDHLYERFAPQTATGAADPASGIREFVVGTGGAGLHPFKAPIANSEFRYNANYGVLKLALDDGKYTWTFIDISGAAIDGGQGACH
jgi:hypothetical protein